MGEKQILRTTGIRPICLARLGFVSEYIEHAPQAPQHGQCGSAILPMAIAYNIIPAFGLGRCHDMQRLRWRFVIATCAAVSKESMAEQLLAFRLSACGPLAGLANEAGSIVGHSALSPLGKVGFSCFANYGDICDALMVLIVRSRCIRQPLVKPLPAVYPNS